MRVTHRGSCASPDAIFEQEFNSLQAQREACEAFITSQRHEGWAGLPVDYDDGGCSGATMERLALQRLLADVTAGRVDIVVVYKIDQLTRARMPSWPAPARGHRDSAMRARRGVSFVQMGAGSVRIASDRTSVLGPQRRDLNSHPEPAFRLLTPQAPECTKLLDT